MSADNLTPTIASEGGFERLVNRVSMMVNYMEINEIEQKLYPEGFTQIDIRLAYAAAVILNEDRR